MLLLETSRKSAFRRHLPETDRERTGQDAVSAQYEGGGQCLKRGRFQDDDVDFLASLRRQKGAETLSDYDE